MPLSGFDIETSRVKKAGLDVCDFHVKLDDEYENYDHDMEYLLGMDIAKVPTIAKRFMNTNIPIARMNIFMGTGDFRKSRK